NDRQAMIALERHVPEGIETTGDITYGDDPAQRMDIFRPGKQALLCLLSCGCTAVRGSAAARTAWRTISRSLPGPAMSPSGWTIFHRTGATYPTPTRQVNQALAYLVKHADEYDIDPTRIFLAGDSAGAQIAGQMANLVTSPSYAAKVGIVPTVDP